MTKEFTPRPYQALIIDHVLTVKRCAVWASMGLGKTVSVLTALETELLFIGRPVLVVAPLRVANTTWPDEVEKWSHLKGLRCSRILGSALDRVAALRCDADIYTINHANIPWLIARFPDREWGTIIADESTKLKGYRRSQGSKQAAALAKIAFKADRFIELTGTPAPNGLKNLWGQIYFLDKGQRLGTSYRAFIDRWFYPTFDGYDVVPRDHAEKEIMALLQDICLTVKTEDYFDFAKPIETVCWVDLPPKAKKHYREMEKAMYTEIAEQGVEAVNAGVKTSKCHQIANGALYIDDKQNYEEVHDEKIDMLKAIIDEANGVPVLVAYNFKSDRSRLLKHFPKAVDLATDEGMHLFKTGKAALGMGHPASIGLGVDGLQDVTNILAFFSLDWNLELYLQFIERIGPVRQLQAGHTRPVFIYYIMARGTIDETIKERLETKKSVQELLTDGMRKWQKTLSSTK